MPSRALVFRLAALLALACRGSGDPAFVAWPESPEPAPAVRLVRRDLDAAVVEAMKAWHVPGAAVVVVYDGRVEYLAGHGVRRVGTVGGVTPDTLFPLASCSKAFTAAALARLIDEGRAGWDDPVRRYLPWFELSDPGVSARVTLRDLLCHRTGVASHDLLWYRAGWPPEEAVRRLRYLPLARPFREALQYQSTMVTAAGLAVAAAAGEPWADVIRDRLLVPLDMGRTLTVAPTAAEPDRAWPHRAQGDGVVSIPLYPLTVPNAAGSIHSTARDLAAWLRLHLGEGKVGRRRLISRAQMRQLWTAHVPIVPSPSQASLFPATRRHAYGLAWVLQDHEGLEVVAHGGAIDGFRVHIAFVPRRRLAVAVLCNLDQTPMPHALASTLIDRILGLPRYDWHALHQAHLRRDADAAHDRALARSGHRPPGARPPHPPAAYAGTFAHPAYEDARVVVEGGKLLWRWRGEDAPLGYVRGETFFVTSELLGDADLTFRFEGGKAVEVKVGGRLGVTLRRRADGEHPLRG